MRCQSSTSENNDALSRDVDHIMRTQNAIVKNLEHVQKRNDRKFFLLELKSKEHWKVFENWRK